MNDSSLPDSTNKVFTIYDAWNDRNDSSINSARADIAAGQRVFNEKTFETGTGRTATCSGCHNAPNVGSSTAFRFFDVGVSAPERRRSDVPLFTFQNVLTGETIQTTDPGRALISGRWADMNRFKAPSLRGLAARAPYFHDGSAASIGDVVNHYQQRFQINFSNGEKDQLIRFLEAL
jgi:cytochrome c peroxidase